jgi:hypothetical protein
MVLHLKCHSILCTALIDPFAGVREYAWVRYGFGIRGTSVCIGEVGMAFMI